MKQFYLQLEQCQTEEEVKNLFSKQFKYKINTKNKRDLYTEEILFEFKYSKNLLEIEQRSKVIAQLIYYVRRIKYGSEDIRIPLYLCGFSKGCAFFVETVKYLKIYSSELKKYDWDRAPSIPCPNIVEAVRELKETSEIHVYDFKNSEEQDIFEKELEKRRNRQLSLFSDRKIIDEDNFLTIYEHWNKLFGKYVKNGHKASEYFVSDIEYNKSQQIRETEVLFDLGDGDAKIKNIPIKDYKYFWEIYDKVNNPKIIYSIRQKIDRISENYQRRFFGEFYTPVEFAHKAFFYLEKKLGKEFWNDGNYRIWDMAAGTGNLEFPIPQSALRYCYISTLLADDAKYCKRIFPQATVFQYDYLNDDVNILISPDLLNKSVKPKMPEALINDLGNGNIKWIIFMNPPFATSNDAGLSNDTRKTKDNVSRTSIQKEMEDNNLGETSRELYSQFLFRISKEFKGKKAYLGLFSTLKYINSNNDQKLRDSFFSYKFIGGFCFSSETFYGAKGKFPIGFIMWDLSKKEKVELQDINIDVFNNNAEKIGIKRIKCDHRDSFLSKWPTRPPCKEIMPPFKSAIVLGDKNKDQRPCVAQGFLASLMCNGNDFQQVNRTSLFSGPTANAGGYSIVSGNFEQSMIMYTVRKLPEASWINNRDQFYQPNQTLPQDFIVDCIVWALFSDANNTVSMKDVVYRGVTYTISNNLFPFPTSSVKKWKCSLSDISYQIQSCNSDRFAAKYLSNQPLSIESKALLAIAEEVYREFYSKMHLCNWVDYKITLWDIGFWQIKSAIKDMNDDSLSQKINELKSSHHVLGKKILPKLYEFGFIEFPYKPLEE